LGLLDRFKPDALVPKKLMSDAQAADLKARQDMMQSAIAANPGAMPDLSGDPATLQAQAAEQMAYAAFVQKVHKDGVQAPAVVRRFQATGQTDLGGGHAVEIVVAVKVREGELTDMQVRQHMLTAQLEGLREGAEVVVRYDADDPTRAVLVSWA
jgi:hypothetical protein